VDSIAIVTDSTSDLSQTRAAEHGITVVPLHVTHQGRVYRDGLDITPEAFYPLLEGSDELPKTSQPTPEQFTEVYKPLVEQGKEVLSVHISGGLSSTVDSARSAAERLSNDRIHVVDSGFLSYGLAFQALEAARLAREGTDVGGILERVSLLKERTEMLFTLDTMHYLYKGGRIGKVASLMGSILGIKPVIRVENGVYVPAGKARSIRQALSSIVDFLSKRYRRQKVIVAVGHGRGEEYAAMLREMAVSRLNVAGKPLSFEVGPVIGVHTGPGTVGLAVRPAEY
jgi:DegV family protein with EDD domain